MRHNTIQYTYTTTSDGEHVPDLLKTITDQNGNVVTQNVYDAAGRVTQQTDARSHASTIAYNSRAQTATLTDARSKVWTYTYSNGTLIQVADPYGDLVLYGYDADLNGTTATDCRSGCAGQAHVAGQCPAAATCFTTVSKYDASGNLTEEDDPSPLGYVKKWDYSADNTLKDSIDGRGNTTRYEYDSKGNLTCTMLADVPSGTTTCAAAAQAYKVTYTPDATTGLPTSMTDPNASTTSYTYDAMGDLGSVTTQLANKTQYCYDAGGRMTYMIDPRAPGTETCTNRGSHTWSYAYNDANQITSVTDPLSPPDVTSYGYDPGGNLTSRTDANSHTVHYGYDAANELKCVIGPDSAATTCAAAPTASKTVYVYDNDGNLTSRTDANAHEWDYGFDDANRLTSVTSPKTRIWNYCYFDDGLLKVKVMPSSSSTACTSSDTVTYGYDAIRRLSSIDYSGTITPDVGFSYDGDDNRMTMTTGSATISYAYDTLNNPCWTLAGSSSAACSAPPTGSFAYNYYPGSQLKQVTFPDGAISGYYYDTDDRLCSLKLGGLPTGCNGGTTTRYGYDAANDLVSKTEPTTNGYVATLSYDLADRFTGVTNVKSGTTLSSYAFGSLDGVGNPKSLIALSGGTTTTTNYTYDAYDRLTGACNLANCTGTGLTGLGYTYDPVGNRLTQVTYGSPNVTTSYKYNSDDQLCWTYVGTSANGCANTPSGGTTYTFSANGDETNAGSSRTYSYDLADRMTQAVVSGTTTTYAYDGDGNRLQAATAGGSTTKYLWDTNEPLALLATETDGAGTTLRDYAYGEGLDSFTASGSTYYDHFDAYGSVANITTSGGATRWTYAYDPFGVATSATSSGGSPPTNVMRFDSQLLDPATTLYDVRARVYDQALGRFSQIDPVPNPAAMPYSGSYAYVANRPTVLDDPSGATPIGGIPGRMQSGDHDTVWRFLRNAWNEYSLDTSAGLTMEWHAVAGCANYLRGGYEQDLAWLNELVPDPAKHELSNAPAGFPEWVHLYESAPGSWRYSEAAVDWAATHSEEGDAWLVYLLLLLEGL